MNAHSKRTGSTAVGCLVAVVVVFLLLLLIGTCVEAPRKEIDSLFAGSIPTYIELGKDAPEEYGPVPWGGMIVIDSDKQSIDWRIQERLPKALQARTPSNVVAVVLLTPEERQVAVYKGLTDAVAARGYRRDCRLRVFDIKLGRAVRERVVKGGGVPFQTKFGENQWGRPPSARKIAKAIPLPGKPQTHERGADNTTVNLLIIAVYLAVSGLIYHKARRHQIERPWRSWVPILFLRVLHELSTDRPKVDATVEAAGQSVNPPGSELEQEQGDTTNCPFCTRDVAANSLTEGKNTCPHCGGVFKVAWDD